MKTICIIRDIYSALYRFESEFLATYGLSINEAMLLCALEETQEAVTSTALAARTGMTPSHTSKVIRAVEEKGLIERSLGQADRRQMYFTLSTRGNERLHEINLEKVPLPELLKPLAIHSRR